MDHNKIEALLRLIPVLRGKEIEIRELSGGLTNRNYRIEANGESYVLRVPGHSASLLGIDRACEYACSCAAAALGVGAEVIAFLPDHGVLLTRFIDGDVLNPEDVRRQETLRRVATSLRAYHDSPPGTGAFSPFTTVRHYYKLAMEHAVPFPKNISQALDLLSRVEEGSQTGESPRPCHNDLLSSNFIEKADKEITILDWEYAGMGDRFFDLGNLAANNLFEEQDERALLEFYFEEIRQEHLSRLRLMRLASDMREAMWGFLQSGISNLEFDYLGYARFHLERFLSASLSIELLET